VQGRIVEERGYADLAAAGAVSETVVRQRVSRGLASLRARLQREQP
jgi:DNA-directed RNA polymerase specialized sigma24 family protein